MPRKRFIMNAGRTTKQGQQINVGKDSAEYQAIVSTMTMHPEDMKDAGIASGGSVRVRSEYGEATFKCVEGKVPQGMIFVPVRPADLPPHGEPHRRNRHADVEGVGSRGRANRECVTRASGRRAAARPVVGNDRAGAVHAAPDPRQLSRPGAWLNVPRSARSGRSRAQTSTSKSESHRGPNEPERGQATPPAPSAGASATTSSCTPTASGSSRRRTPAASATPGSRTTPRNGSIPTR